MVLAMVPAVSAAEPKGTEDDPIIMYVGDYTSDYVSKAYGCNNSKHTTVLKYTEIFNGRETELKSSKFRLITLPVCLKLRLQQQKTERSVC